MKTPREIYTEYKIMPSLQLHQLRVAAVGKMVCDHLTKPINANDVILTCLFHDMGNIIKSDLSIFPDFREPEGLEYWQNVKDEYTKKYGTDHHAANAAIAREIGLSNEIIKLMNESGFSRTESVVESSSFELKVYQYADMRVGPYGVLSLDERLNEGRRRYIMRNKEHYESDAVYNKLLRSAHDLEQQIFVNAKMTPTDITDESIKNDIEKLRDYPVN
jgi:hypothetical protein